MREDNPQKKVNEKVQVEKVVPEGQDENAGPRHAIAEPLRSTKGTSYGGLARPETFNIIISIYVFVGIMCFLGDSCLFGRKFVDFPSRMVSLSA